MLKRQGLYNHFCDKYGFSLIMVLGTGNSSFPWAWPGLASVHRSGLFSHCEISRSNAALLSIDHALRVSALGRTTISLSGMSRRSRKLITALTSIVIDIRED
jgi:hypothetical protein